ncbi:MAG TPA: hypothetical protein VMT20_25930 [Terriglobia bacterium]|nr:hypothetical protein [Terriglobia bacterium]
MSRHSPGLVSQASKVAQTPSFGSAAFPSTWLESQKNGALAQIENLRFTQVNLHSESHGRAVRKPALPEERNAG